MNSGSRHTQAASVGITRHKYFVVRTDHTPKPPVRPLEYGKMSLTDYCPHGFSKKSPTGVPVICGFCEPERYAERMKEKGAKYPSKGSKRVLAW